MDAHDLFRQLTRGAKFRKPKQESKCLEPTLPVITQTDNEVKEELDDELDLEVEEQADNKIEPELHFFTDSVEIPKKKEKSMTPKEKEQHIKEETIAALRRKNNIKVMGKNLPSPIASFGELAKDYNMSAQLVNNLENCNYPEPTPIQMQAMPILLQGRQLMACAPTGSGKTIAFLAPILNYLGRPQKNGFRAIFLAPTRELAQQIYRECVRLAEKTALRIHIINKVNQAKQKFGPDSNKKFDILIATPNRVRFLLQQEPPLLDLKSIEWFVIDEADRLMEEGQNNFKDQLDDILAACTNTKRKVALFSATYTVPVAKWALKNLKNLARIIVGQQNSATDTVKQELLFVGSEQGKLLAVRDMVRTGLKPPVLVFVQSKDRAKQLFQELLYDGINVDVIHAERTQQQRDNCVRAFREGNIWILICTELMGRGIDFKGVNLVINYDFPPSTISYIHRIGRTGRAGRPGRAITFYTQDDTPQLRSIAQIIKNSGGEVPNFMLSMKKPRKSELRRLADIAPKRENILTNLSSKSNPEDNTKSKDGIKNKGKNIKVENGKKAEHPPKKRKFQDNEGTLKQKNKSKKPKKSKEGK